MQKLSSDGLWTIQQHINDAITVQWDVMKEGMYAWIHSLILLLFITAKAVAVSWHWELQHCLHPFQPAFLLACLTRVVLLRLAIGKVRKIFKIPLCAAQCEKMNAFVLWPGCPLSTVRVQLPVSAADWLWVAVQQRLSNQAASDCARHGLVISQRHNSSSGTGLYSSSVRATLDKCPGARNKFLLPMAGNCLGFVNLWCIGDPKKFSYPTLPPT